MPEIECSAAESSAATPVAAVMYVATFAAMAATCAAIHMAATMDALMDLAVEMAVACSVEEETAVTEWGISVEPVVVVGAMPAAVPVAAMVAPAAFVEH